MVIGIAVLSISSFVVVGIKIPVCFPVKLARVSSLLFSISYGIKGYILLSVSFAPN